MGDRVLQDFASRARQALRDTDLIGRYGGEEFVVLLPETDAEMALVVAERIRNQCSTQPDIAPVTVSIGVVSSPAANPDQLATHLLEDMIQRADKALYQAKAAGRNRVEIAPPAGSHSEPMTH